MRKYLFDRGSTQWWFTKCDNPECRMNALQTLGGQLFNRLSISKHIIVLVMSHKPCPVVQLHLSIVHQSVQNGDRAAVDAMHTVQDGNVAVAGSSHERRIAPNCVAVNFGSSLLNEITGSHVLVKYHWFDVLTQTTG